VGIQKKEGMFRSVLFLQASHATKNLLHAAVNSFEFHNYTGAKHWPGEQAAIASDFGQCVAPVQLLNF
jgi:hypothetical protein